MSRLSPTSAELAIVLTEAEADEYERQHGRPMPLGAFLRVLYGRLDQAQQRDREAALETEHPPGYGHGV